VAFVGLEGGYERLVLDLVGGPTDPAQGGASTGALYGNSTGSGTERAELALSLGNLLTSAHTVEAIINMGAVSSSKPFTQAFAQYLSAAEGQGSASSYFSWFNLQQFIPSYGATAGVGDILVTGLVANMRIVSVEPNFNFPYPSPYIVNPIVHAPSEWLHVALVVEPDQATGLTTETLYVAGQSVHAETGEPQYPSAAVMAQPVAFVLGINNDGAQSPAIHGFRVTRRALYTGNFTPPTTITGLA
jgi:hypothetical protein